MAQKTRLIKSSKRQCLRSWKHTFRSCGKTWCAGFWTKCSRIWRAAGASGGAAAALLQAVSAIHAGTTQKEILRALLESTAGYSGRAALFVIKAGAATGWQGRAFDNNDDVKDFSLDVNSASAGSRVCNRERWLPRGASEMDPRFISQFGAPAEDQVLLLPLRLKDKVAALVYADAGTRAGGNMDAAALELLVSATSAWLEVASLRKQAAKEGATEAEKFEAPPVQTVSSFSDPFAAHAPKHVVSVPVAVANPRWQRPRRKSCRHRRDGSGCSGPCNRCVCALVTGGCGSPSQGATFCPAVDG